MLRSPKSVLGSPGIGAHVPGTAAHVLRNRCSRSAGTGAHDRPEYAPKAETLLEACFKRGESVSAVTSRLLLLLDDYGAQELRAAVDEALARGTPHVASIVFLLARRRRAAQRRLTPAVDLSRRPDLKDLYVKPHSPETYDELTRRDDDDNDDDSD
jgi:hypothetical protein